MGQNNSNADFKWNDSLLYVVAIYCQLSNKKKMKENEKKKKKQDLEKIPTGITLKMVLMRHTLSVLHKYSFSAYTIVINRSFSWCWKKGPVYADKS